MTDADPWQHFRTVTQARIGLGRAGDALPTASLLAFTLAHARARDAVHGAPDFDAIAARLRPTETLLVHSRAPDRLTYLRRPDLGRQLHDADRDLLQQGAWDAVFIVADGLSAAAIEAHAGPVITAAQARLQGWRLAPIVLARQARVALGDEIGAALGARLAVLLIGERPGLSVQDSLGIYLTYAPCAGRTDAQRNCISNIHADGVSYAVAADKLVWLMTQALRLSLTGIGLKEDAPLATERREASGDNHVKVFCVLASEKKRFLPHLLFRMLRHTLKNHAPHLRVAVRAPHFQPRGAGQAQRDRQQCCRRQPVRDHEAAADHVDIGDAEKDDAYLCQEGERRRQAGRPPVDIRGVVAPRNRPRWPAKRPPAPPGSAWFPARIAGRRPPHRLARSRRCCRRRTRTAPAR